MSNDTIDSLLAEINSIAFNEISALIGQVHEVLKAHKVAEAMGDEAYRDFVDKLEGVLVRDALEDIRAKTKTLRDLIKKELA